MKIHNPNYKFFKCFSNKDDVDVDSSDGSRLLQRDVPLYFSEYWLREVQQYGRWVLGVSCGVWLNVWGKPWKILENARQFMS